MPLVIPKAGAKHELLFNTPPSEPGLLKKSSCLIAALGVTKFITVIDMILDKLVVVLKSNLDVQQTTLSCQHFAKSSVWPLSFVYGLYFFHAYHSIGLTL
jgi:hypothetical protein